MATKVWVRKVSGGKVALVFINVGATVAASVTCGGVCVEVAELVGKAVTVRDLWLHEDVGTEQKLVELSAMDLASARWRASHLMLLLTPK